MRTGRPFVAYLVLLDFTVFHSTRHGSEALAPEVQPFQSREYGTNKCKLFDKLTLNTLKGFSRFTITLFSYRSCRFWPTPGRLTTTGIPSFLSSAAGPIPLSLSSCGVLKVPPDIMTSFSAYAVPGYTISFSTVKGLTRSLTYQVHQRTSPQLLHLPDTDSGRPKTIPQSLAYCMVQTGPWWPNSLFECQSCHGLDSVY